MVNACKLCNKRKGAKLWVNMKSDEEQTFLAHPICVAQNYSTAVIEEFHLGNAFIHAIALLESMPLKQFKVSDVLKCEQQPFGISEKVRTSLGLHHYIAAYPYLKPYFPKSHQDEPVSIFALSSALLSWTNLSTSKHRPETSQLLTLLIWILPRSLFSSATSLQENYALYEDVLMKIKDLDKEVKTLEDVMKLPTEDDLQKWG